MRRRISSFQLVKLLFCNNVLTCHENVKYKIPSLSQLLNTRAKTSIVVFMQVKVTCVLYTTV